MIMLTDEQYLEWAEEFTGHQPNARVLAALFKERDTFKEMLEKIKGGHSDDPQLDAIRALEQK